MSLQTKYNNYVKWIRLAQDKYGFVETKHCDALLFTGLVGCVPEVAVHIDAAFNPKTGQWYRRPIDKPCFPCGSKSSISRDMLLGLAWYCYYNKRLDISEQVIKYALRNWGIMGEAEDWKTKLGRCLMTPGLLSTYCYISYRLGGPNRWWLRWIPQIESRQVTDYQAHLSVLHIMLRNKLTGNNDNSDLIDLHVKREPNNPLFRIAAGHWSEAESILMNPSWFPEERLPHSRDRKAQWLQMRDEGKDWEPSLDGEIHSGGDFLFCYWLLNNY